MVDWGGVNGQEILNVEWRWRAAVLKTECTIAWGEASFVRSSDARRISSGLEKAGRNCNPRAFP